MGALWAWLAQGSLWVQAGDGAVQVMKYELASF